MPYSYPSTTQQASYRLCRPNFPRRLLTSLPYPTLAQDHQGNEATSQGRSIWLRLLAQETVTNLTQSRGMPCASRGNPVLPATMLAHQAPCDLRVLCPQVLGSLCSQAHRWHIMLFVICSFPCRQVLGSLCDGVDFQPVGALGDAGGVRGSGATST